MDQNLEALAGVPDHQGERGGQGMSDDTAVMTAKLNVTRPENLTEPLIGAGAGAEPPCQGRGAPGALTLARGVCRALSQLGSAVLSELRLPNGRRADIAALDGKGRITIVEIKSSIEDFRADRKWPDYLQCCDAFYFAVSERFPRILIPEECGLMVADAYGAAIVRPAPPARLDASRRRAVTLAFALSAAQRLHRLADPLAMDGLVQETG